MSGLLINDLSDHKMNFTWHKNNSYIENVNKLVEIEKRDDTSMSIFAEELISLNIYDKLDQNIAMIQIKIIKYLLKLLTMLVRSIY